MLKLDCCDFSVASCFKHLKSALHGTVVAVNCMVVTSRPQFILRYDKEENAEAPFHSAMLQTSNSDSRYVADFTIEQSRYDYKNWLSPLEEYLNECTADGKFQLCDLEK